MLKTIRRYVGLSLLLVMLASGWVWARGGWQQENDSPVKVVFIGATEDSDCILLYQGENAILIDTGVAADKEYIISAIRNHGVSKIQYMVITHPDKDHIGNAVSIIEEFTVENVIQTNVPFDNDAYMLLNTTLEKNRIRSIIPTTTRRYHSGAMSMVITPPHKSTYNNENNYSLVTSITHRNVSMLFMGDALATRLEEMNEYDFSALDLMKVTYHGRNVKGSPEFILQNPPIYAVVTSSSASKEVKKALRTVDAKVFYTVRQPQTDLVFISDGELLYPEE